MPLIRKDATPPSSASSPTAPAGATDQAIERLSNGTRQERWTAARALAATPSAIGALGQALSGETDPQVRQAIFTSLTQIPGAHSARAIAPHLRSDDSNLRAGALDALRSMAGAVAQILPDLLADPDPDVRLLACEIARELPPVQATQLLCGALADEQEANVCAAAVDVLADNGAPHALPVLAVWAQRFQGEAFLGFAIKLAMERLAASAPPQDG